MLRSRHFKLVQSGLGFKSRSGDTGYPDWGFSWFSSVSPCKYWDSILKLCHGCFLPYPFQFIIHCHPFSRCCIIRVSEIASLNKLQRNKQKMTRFTKIIQRIYGKHAAILRWSTHIFSYYLVSLMTSLRQEVHGTRFGIQPVWPSFDVD
jgi:hypothetical protein